MDKNGVIEVKNLTKDYGDKRGVFNISFKIEKGEMLGFVGTNGSGKTTTIRNIMGFIKPTSGHCYVNGLDTWKYPSEIAKHIGYVPGEISFPDLKTGTAFLKSQAEFLGIKDMSYANSLIERLQLDPRANLKRMSKGMKQKTALVAALMGNPDIIILDEPTTGLDPLMRVAFMDIIEEEHAKGKTILMSSHMFEEVEESCDSVALIANGHLIDKVDMIDIKYRQNKDYKIEFNNNADYLKFLSKEQYRIIRKQPNYNQITVNIKNSEINDLFNSLKKYDVKFLSEVKYTLERYFKEKIDKAGLINKKEEK